MSEKIMTQNFEQRIYSAYRLALRSFRRADNGSTCRASDRRNRARKVVVTRYNVSFQDVKRIVAKFDAKNGVEHPDDPSYVLTRRFKQAEAEFLKNPVEVCKCGSTEHVRLRPEPVDWEVYDTFTPVVSCYFCYRILGEDL